MSITKRGVKFTAKNHRSRLLWATLFLIEGVLSIFVYVSLAAHVIWPDGSQAATGVASVLSYEGRLTDASGNPLGGTGTDYCFKFAIYDDADVDAPETKLWPSGSPTGQSITVIDGVFNALIGQADTLDYNFYTSDTVYLNVEVATKVGGSCTNGDETYETLRSRQRIAATGYAISAANVYSTLLKTDISNSKVQIGTGTGTASQKFLALDVKNTSDTVGGACSTSGTLWYNSTDSRAYVCDNSTIQVIGNLGTIVGIKEASAGSAISSGTVVFSGINGISVSQNAQTLSISGLNAFGVSNIGNTIGNTGSQTGTIVFSGGNNITLSQVTGAGGVHTLGISGRAMDTMDHFWPYAPTFVAASQLGNGFQYLLPITVNNYITATAVKVYASISMSTSSNSSHAGALSLNFAIYSKNANTLSSMSSVATNWVWSVTSNQISTGAVSNVSNFSILSGYRALPIVLNVNMSPGEYWLGVWSRTSTTNANWFTASNFLISVLSNAYGGNLSLASNSSMNEMVGWGIYSNASTANFQTTVAISDIKGTTAGWRRIPYIYFSNF